MKFVLDAHSAARLNGLHPDLVKVIADCAAANDLPFQFGITEGLRTVQQQQANVARVVSWTLNSRHLDGHAVDLVVLLPGVKLGELVPCWAWPPYNALAAAMKAAAQRTGVPIVWGGDWKEKDGPHYELPWDRYPSRVPQQPETVSA